MKFSRSDTLQFRALVSVTVAAALMRLLPHPYNLTPIAGLALFGGAHFRDLRLAFAVPLLAMFASDLVLAVVVYGGAAFRSMPLVYLAFAMTVALGRCLRSRRTSIGIGLASVGAALLFYLITNLGVWLQGNLYPMSAEGLVACYAAAIPYLRNDILGNLFYALVFFGGFALVKQRSSALQGDSASIVVEPSS